MTIVSKNIQYKAGAVGVNPRRVQLIVTDGLTALTTAGFLNASNLEGDTVLATDIFDCYYSFNTATNVGTYVELLPTITSGVITLSQEVDSGNVLLPVVSHHIASFNGTSGQIADGAWTAIQKGSLQAGLSGTAGTLISFPSVAAEGSLILAAVSNATGNFTTTISNAAAVAQSTVVTIPDPGNAVSGFLVSAGATPFVSGNVPVASGTAGLMIDSGVPITNISTIQTISVTMNTAAVTAAYTTPVQLVAAQAGKVIYALNAYIYTASTGHTPYATGGVGIVQYNSTIHGAGTNALAATIPAAEITAAASQVYNLGPIAATALTGQTNVGLFFSNQTGVYTNGTGTNVTITIDYVVITATI